MHVLKDTEREAELPLREVSIEDILDAQRKEQEEKQDQQKKIAKALKERGMHFMADAGQDDMY